MVIRIFISACISIAFIGCNKNKDKLIPKIYRSIDLEQIGINNLKHISIEQNKNTKHISIACNSIGKKYGLADLIDSIWYLPLQVTENSIIGEITKVIPFQNNYLVFDKSKANAVFAFDREGRFLKQIGHPGNGPNEYLEIGDVAVHNDSIIIYDRRKGRLVTYDVDGNFVKATRAYASFRNFDLLKDQNFVYEVFLDYNVHLPEISNAKLLVTDPNFNLIATALSYDASAVSEYRFFTNRSGLTEASGGGILYSCPLTDTILLVKNAFTIEPSYRLDFWRL